IETALDVETRPAKVRLEIDPGPLYRVSEYNVTGASPALSDGSLHIDTSVLGIERDAPAEAQPIVQSQARLLAGLAHQGYPLAAITGQNIVVDHAARTVAIDLRVDLGPKARFGEVHIEGLERVRREFVEARLPWHDGDPYDAA